MDIVCNLLKDCDLLDDYYEKFKDNCIDDKSLLLLDDEGLMQLLPVVGPRMKFKAVWKEWKIHQSCDVCTILIGYKLLDLGNVQEYLPGLESEKDPAPVQAADVKKQVLSFASETSSQEHNKSNSDGRAIVAEAKRAQGLLKENQRKRLSQIVVGSLLENNPTKIIAPLEFKQLAYEIEQLFPKENSVIYYSPYEGNVDSKYGKKNASGKLYETYISRRRKLRARGELPGTSRSSSSNSCSNVSTASGSAESVSTVSDNSEEDHAARKDKLTWLNNSVDPWQMVKEYWSATASFRLNTLTEGSVDKYFKLYPALQQPSGYTLLLQDFERLYPEKNDGLFSTIVLIRKNIIQLAEEKLKNTRDKDIKQVLQGYITLCEDCDLEASTNISLILLAYVIGTSVPRRQGKTGHWKPSRAEVRDGFITQAASSAVVNSVVNLRRAKFQKLGKTVQPFIVYVGESAAQVQSAYVIVNNTNYCFPKLVEAVDATFKIFHATGACYPEECMDIWLVIQIGFYKIKTKFDKPNQATNSLLTDLGLWE